MKNSVPKESPEKVGCVATEELEISSVRVAADTAMALLPKVGGGNREVCNLVAAGALAGAIEEHVKHVAVEVAVCEGRKDRHARLPYRLLLTRPRANQATVHAILDPLECEGPLAKTGLRSRASMVLLGFVPPGAYAKLDSAERVKYLCVPPGSPTCPGGVQLDAPAKTTVDSMCDHFQRDPSDVDVTILTRSWTADLVEDYKRAGATVRQINAGDFQAMIEAGTSVEPSGPIHIAAGMGGLPEAMLAALYARWSGGRLFVQPVPAEMEKRPHEVSTRVYDEQSLILSDDCLLCLAGITEANAPALEGARFLVPGVRSSKVTRTDWVSVMVASPAFEDCRYYVVEFEGREFRRLTRLEHNESLDEHLLLRFLAEGREIEARQATDRENPMPFFSGRAPFVPGLESLSDEQVIELLEGLHARGRLARRDEVTQWDTNEYHVFWSLN